MPDVVYSNNVAGGNASVHYGNVITENIVINPDLSESMKKNQIVQWLNAADASKEHNASREKHEGDTGSWLLEGTKYAEWKGARNSLFWLNGPAGAGKSILCSTIIDDIQAHSQNGTNQADAYCVIVQLYRQCKNTLDKVNKAFDESREGQHQPSRATLLKIIQAIINNFDSVFIIIDALDECPTINDERDKLLDTICELLSWKCPSLHLLCTSRKEIDIENVFMNDLPREVAFQTIQLSADDVAADIKTFLHSQLSGRKFASWDSASKEEVERKLADRANGMFRLAALQLEELSKALTKSAIKASLDHLPASLDAFYERLLLDIPEEVAPQAFRALQWLAFAARPLSVKELAEAAVINQERSPLINPDDRFLNAQDIFKIIPSGLASYVSVGGDFFWDDFYSEILDSEIDAPEDLVQLAHFSVKEYLMSPRIEQTRVGFYCLDEMEAHKIIAEVSLTYFLQQAPNGSMTTEEEGNAESAKLFNVLSEAPLLHYAANCWPYHIRALGDLTTIRLCSIMAQIFTNESALQLWDNLYLTQGSRAFGYHDRSIIDSPTRKREPWITTKKSEVQHPMTYASYLGLLPLVQTLISNGYDDSEIPDDPNADRPLIKAAYHGYTSVVRALLDANANVNSRGENRPNALQAASRNGHLEIVQILLEAGGDVNASAGFYGTALSAASQGGSSDVLRLLLAFGADIDATDSLYGNALQAAILNNFEDGIQLLLQKGAEVNIPGGRYGNALQAASFTGNFKTVALLIKAGAAVNANGGYYGNALQAASAQEHSNVVQQLLKEGADINATGGIYGSALQAASNRGSLNIVTLLIEAGAFVNAQGGTFDSALIAASTYGYTDVADYLLHNGADIHAKSAQNGNALQVALRRGDVALIELLLENGADVNEAGGSNIYALHTAVHYQPPSVVLTLLQAGAQLLTKGRYGGYPVNPPLLTPLQVAVFGGNPEMVQFLLENGSELKQHGKAETLIALAELGRAMGHVRYEFDDDIFELIDRLFQRGTKRRHSMS